MFFNLITGFNEKVNIFKEVIEFLVLQKHTTDTDMHKPIHLRKAWVIAAIVYSLSLLGGSQKY